MFVILEDFAELLMKTETAKIENFTNIEEIKGKLKKEVTSLRDELKGISFLHLQFLIFDKKKAEFCRGFLSNKILEYKRSLLDEQERIDEEKMMRLELEEQICEMKKRIKT